MQRARALFQAQRFEEAKSAFVELSRRVPNDAETWFMLGGLSGHLGQFEEAVRYFRRSISLAPGRAETHFHLGMVLRQMGALDDAVTSLHRAIHLDPANAAAIHQYQSVSHQLAKQQTLCIRMRGNLEICVPGSIQLMTPYVLLEQEDWFEDEIRFVRLFVEPGMQVIDIGANYGVYALAMGDLVGSTGRVLAFEPAAATAGYLRRSIERNKLTNTMLVQRALSDRDGSAHFKLNENSELNAISRQSDSSAAETVQLSTLDAVVAEFGLSSVSFVKLDAEGEEINILRGGQRFLRDQSPLIMFELQYDQRPNLGLVNDFASLGYEMYRLIPGLNILTPWESSGPANLEQLNLFCCKPDRATLLEQRGFLVSRQVLTGLSDNPAGLAEFDWLDSLSKRPYARGWASAWREKIHHCEEPGWAHNTDALARFFLSTSTGVQPGMRVVMLYQAFCAADAAVKEGATPSRLQTLARVAWEWGLSNVAIDALDQLIACPDEKLKSIPNEPFLAVSRRHEQIEPVDDFHWYRESWLEMRELLCAYSSYFSGLPALTRLNALHDIGCNHPQMERRRQLVRMRHGLQKVAECSQVLAAASDENLNQRYWCRSRR